jgi:type I restriction enzyme, S subunit
MTAVWSTVALGDVLRRSEHIIPLDPEATYKEVTVRINGKGVVERRQVQGVEIAADRRYQVKSGQFIISRIDARHGASGLIPDELDGAIVTNDFPLFDVARDRLDAAFLGWMSKTASFVELCKRASEGTTNRVRLSEDRFKALNIPLPPLDEQRRIVARIEELAAKVEEARGLRQLLVGETQKFSSVAISQFVSAHGNRYVRLDEIIDDSSLRNGKSIKSIPAETGIHCLTLGALRDGRVDTSNSKPVPMQADDARPYLVTKGDVFVVRGNGSKELCGRAGIVLEDASDMIFPDLFIKVSLPRDIVDPRFFVAVWNASELRSWIEESAKTTSGIWKINQGHILAARIPLPPATEQRRIVAELDLLQAKVDSAKALQAETAAELNAMLPAILDKAFKGEL